MKHLSAEFTEANKVAQLQRACQLLTRYPVNLINFIVFTDKELFTVARPTHSQNNRMYAHTR